MSVVKPETVIRWHRKSFKLFWRFKSRQKGSGQPPINPEIPDLILKIANATRSGGAPRVHGELLKLGIKIQERTVSNLMHRRDNDHTITDKGNAMERSITLMHGYTCALKTTISKALAAKCGLRRVETKMFGAIKTEAEKLRRYEQVASAAGTILDAGNSVVLDGTYSKFECRNRVYRLAERTGVEAAIIHCECGNDEEVLRRLWARKKNEGVCYEEWMDRSHDGLETDKARFEGLRIIKMNTTYLKC